MEKTIEQITQELKEPLPKQAVSPHPTKPYLSSIKGIYIVERFNDVFGLGGWKINNEFVLQSGKMVVVKSTFYAERYKILVPDIFGGNDNTDLGDAFKGACTDALSKIGSYLFVGMDVYKGISENAQQAKDPIKQKEKEYVLEPIEKINNAKTRAELVSIFNSMPISQQKTEHILIAIKKQTEKITPKTK